MKKLMYTAILAIATLYAPSSMAITALNVIATAGIDKAGYIDPLYAMCVLGGNALPTHGANRNVGIAWSPGPEGTKSYVVIAVDTDFPTDDSDAGSRQKIIPSSMKRRDFYHWIMYDIPPTITSIPAAADSFQYNAHGKYDFKTPYGTRGANDYATLLEKSQDHAGAYAGYDGPCPATNDQIVHHYHFRVFALNIPSLGLRGAGVYGVQTMVALLPHVLAWGEVVGKYTLNRNIPR